MNRKTWGVMAGETEGRGNAVERCPVCGRNAKDCVCCPECGHVCALDAGETCCPVCGPEEGGETS